MFQNREITEWEDESPNLLKYVVYDWSDWVNFTHCRSLINEYLRNEKR